MDQNIISIIIATKNGGHFLLRALSSIEKQTEKNIEVTIISDGSTDNTVAVAKELAKTRPFIRVIELENNVGPGSARNIAIKEAHGNYIAIIDDDDEWLDNDKLKNQKKFLDENPDYVLVGAAETELVSDTQGYLFTYKPKKVDPEIRSKILLKNQFMTSSVLFRKDAFEKVGGFESLYLAEDYDLWLRMAQIGKVANIDGAKTRYYSRPSGSQQKNKKKMNRAVLTLVKKYKKSFPHPWLGQLVAYARIVVG